MGKKLKLHIIVAQQFYDNPLNKKIVDHIDGNARNCNKLNLWWFAESENAGNIHTSNGEVIPHYKSLQGPCFTINEYGKHHYSNLFYDAATGWYYCASEGWYWLTIPRKDASIHPKADDGKRYQCLIHKLNENLRNIMVIPHYNVECVIKPSTPEIVESSRIPQQLIDDNNSMLMRVDKASL
jgi:hypothetical protein